MRKDGIPKRFQLAGHAIQVRILSRKEWPHGSQAIGIYVPDMYRIDILRRRHMTAMQQVFCHEFIHAVLTIAGHDALSNDEDFVDRLGHLLQQALTTFE